MIVTPLAIPDVLVIQPKVYSDERGYFFESFNQHLFKEILAQEVSFVQDNQSLSRKNVLRGLHYQKIKAQAKLVRVLQGEIFDVAVDIRPNSPTFGQWVSERLSAENNKQLWIPKGFAHGFLALSSIAIIAYKVTDFYNPGDEQTISWNNKRLDIKWPLHGAKPILSYKDANPEAALFA